MAPGLQPRRVAAPESHGALAVMSSPVWQRRAGSSRRPAPGGASGVCAARTAAVVPVEATISRHDLDGRVLYLSLFRDITDRKRTEAALQQREAQLTEAQRIAHLGSWEWDIAADRLTWSDEQYRIFGHEPQAFLLTPKSGGAGIHPDDSPACGRPLRDALARESPSSTRPASCGPDGEERVVHCRGTVLRDAAGQPARMVGTAQDITERTRTEHALREQRDFLQAVIDAVPDPIFVKDDAASLGPGQSDVLEGVRARPGDRARQESTSTSSPRARRRCTGRRTTWCCGRARPTRTRS